MAIEQLSAEGAIERTIAYLGLDPEYVDLTFTEAIAESIRRVASLLCPCPPRALRVAVNDLIELLVDESFELKDIIEGTLEQLVAHGDLVEARMTLDDSGNPNARILFLAPPSFVVRDSGAVLLIGVASDGAPLIPSALATRVECDGYLRWLQSKRDESLQETLPSLGLVELTRQQWLRVPSAASSAALLNDVDTLIGFQGRPDDLGDIRVLDPERSVRHYRSRWIALRHESGRYIARRPQAYGADLWCYIEVEDGGVTRLLDLPLPGSEARGCDDAWWIQAAIDAERGHPQVVQVRTLQRPGTPVAVDFFHPIPRWAQRQLELIGQPGEGSSLFTFTMPSTEAAEELLALENSMWLTIDRTK